MIHSKIIGIGVITGLCSMAALAEPAVQPGDTLESLSKVKVTTTVNGQPGSISDLVNSGQVQQSFCCTNKRSAYRCSYSGRCSTSTSSGR